MKKNSIHTQAGFKVPCGYFDQLTDRVLENTQDQELQDHAGFKMPEDYLVSLEDRVMSRLGQETRVIPLPVSKTKTMALSSSCHGSFIYWFYNYKWIIYPGQGYFCRSRRPRNYRFLSRC